MDNLKSFSGGKKVYCEYAETYLQFIKDLKHEGCDDEFIRHALNNLTAVYVAVNNPGTVWTVE